jgi:hypothetical protein
MRYRNPSGSAVIDTGTVALPANQWALVRVSGVTTTADDMALGPLLGTSALANDMIDIGPHMTVEGTYTGDFIDGTKPLSKWLGAADASVSLGYPPQLFDIAGKPEFDVSAVGTYTLPGGFTNTEPRTIYTVYNNLQDIVDSTVPTILTYGATALNDVIPNQYITLRQQAWTGDINMVLARRTGGNGAGASGAKVNVNLVTWGLNDSGVMFSQINNGSQAVDGTFVMDVPHEKISIGAATAFGSHVRTLIYRGYHSSTIRTAMARYLGNKYGAYIA